MESKTKNSSNKQQNKTHNLSLKMRKHLKVTGIKEVISYNENRVLLQSIQGLLDIKGKNLNIQKLNLENKIITIKGFIKSLEYTNKKPETNLLKRIFK